MWISLFVSLFFFLFIFCLSYSRPQHYVNRRFTSQLLHHITNITATSTHRNHIWENCFPLPFYCLSRTTPLCRSIREISKLINNQSINHFWRSSSPSPLNSKPVIEPWTHFLAKDRGKEFIFSKIIEELKKERKRDEDEQGEIDRFLTP